MMILQFPLKNYFPYRQKRNALIVGKIRQRIIQREADLSNYYLFFWQNGIQNLAPKV